MKNFSIILSAVALVIASVALITATKKGSTMSAEAVADILNDNPKIVADALSAYTDQQRAAEEKAAAEAMAKYASDINNSDNVPFVGPKDAKVVVVEFFDFSCIHCKHLGETIEKIIAANSDVKFVFKPLSFVSPVSKYQAKAAFAANKQGKFLEFYKELMDNKNRMSEADVDAIASKVGLNVDQYKNDLNSSDVENGLKEVSDLAQLIQVNGVPTLFINGQQNYSRSVDDLQNAINAFK